jgi:beta-galactosidase
VTFNGNALTGWQVYTLPMSDPHAVKFASSASTTGPAFWVGSFSVSAVGDTFLDVSKLHMGVVWVNGHNLGRVWNIGPQQSLYVPAPWLHAGGNEVIVFDTNLSGPPRLSGVSESIWKRVVN